MKQKRTDQKKIIHYWQQNLCQFNKKKKSVPFTALTTKNYISICGYSQGGNITLLKYSEAAFNSVTTSVTSSSSKKKQKKRNLRIKSKMLVDVQ